MSSHLMKLSFHTTVKKYSHISRCNWKYKLSDNYSIQNSYQLIIKPNHLTLCHQRNSWYRRTSKKFNLITRTHLSKQFPILPKIANIAKNHTKNRFRELKLIELSRRHIFVARLFIVKRFQVFFNYFKFVPSYCVFCCSCCRNWLWHCRSIKSQLPS